MNISALGRARPAQRISGMLQANGQCAVSCLQHPRENVQHFLMDCPTYKHKHWKLYRQSKIREPLLKALLNKEELVIPLANYLRATGRFKVQGQEKAPENWARYSVIHPDGNLHPDSNSHHHVRISPVLGEFRTEIDRSEIELPEFGRITKNYQDLMNLDNLEGHQIAILTQSQFLFHLS